MNSAFEIIIFIFQIVFIFVLLYIAYRLFKVYKSTNFDKRFGPYSIEILDDDEESLFDILIYNYELFRDKISKKLLNIKIFTSYSKRYEKYNHDIHPSDIDNMNYITNKFFIGFICVILLLLSAIFKVEKINFSLIVLVFLIGFFILDIYLIINEKIRKNSIEKDMNKAIIIMNNAFKSGYSIMQAIYLVHSQLDGPISDEFRKMYIDITFGLNMEVVFNRFAKRINCVEANYMATSLGVVNKTGGDIVQVFNAVEKNSFTRRKLKDELNSVSSSARAMYKILICIPIFIVLLLLVLNPSYFMPLFTTGIGFLCFLLSLIIYILYIIIIRKIVYVEVKL